MCLERVIRLTLQDGRFCFFDIGVNLGVRQASKITETMFFYLGLVNWHKNC